MYSARQGQWLTMDKICISAFYPLVRAPPFNLNPAMQRVAPRKNSTLNHVRCILMMEQLESSRNIGAVAWNKVNQRQTFL